jgi:hypothetical protein
MLLFGLSWHLIAIVPGLSRINGRTNLSPLQTSGIDDQVGQEVRLA